MGMAERRQTLEEVRVSRLRANDLESGSARRQRLGTAKLADTVTQLRRQLHTLRSTFTAEMRVCQRSAATSLETGLSQATALVQKERNLRAEAQREAATARATADAATAQLAQAEAAASAASSATRSAIADADQARRAAEAAAAAAALDKERGVAGAGQEAEAAMRQRDVRIDELVAQVASAQAAQRAAEEQLAAVAAHAPASTSLGEQGKEDQGLQQPAVSASKSPKLS